MYMILSQVSVWKVYLDVGFFCLFTIYIYREKIRAVLLCYIWSFKVCCVDFFTCLLQLFHTFDCKTINKKILRVMIPLGDNLPWKVAHFDLYFTIYSLGVLLSCFELFTWILVIEAPKISKEWLWFKMIVWNSYM